MIEAFILFVSGLMILLAGAEGLVRGASSIATRSNISPLVIGLTVVAFGTSTPELVIAVTAIFNQSTDIGVGNIIGSNIANVLFVLGLAALIGRLSVSQSTVKKELPFLIAASIVLFIMSADSLLAKGVNSIDRLDGALLLLLFSLFMWYVFKLTQKSLPIGAKLFRIFRSKSKSYPYRISIPMTVAGLFGLVVGATLTVDGAEILARAAGAPELAIGLTIVAVGTSLPELATTVVAVYRRNSDLAIGNIVGSNIFNILWVIGIASLVSPLAISEPLLLNIGIAVIAPIILLVVLVAGKLQLNRLAGMVFLGLYALYVLYLMTNG
jgi:cation:H+ antiporter